MRKGFCHGIPKGFITAVQVRDRGRVDKAQRAHQGDLQRLAFAHAEKNATW